MSNRSQRLMSDVGRAALIFACLVVTCLIATAVAFSPSGGPSQSATGSVHPAGWGQTPPSLRFAAPAPLTGVQTATMFDAVDLSQIPARPFAAAGYTAGNWITWPSVRAMAAHAVSIAIHANYHAVCLDVEPGDASVSQAGPWAVADMRAGFAVPCVYGDLSNMPAIKASLAAWLGSGWRARVLLWLAWYRGFPGLVAGYDAVQYNAHCLGRNLDCSTVSLRFLTMARPPYVPPKPPARLVCFGTHAQVHNRTCKAVRARVASLQRAEASTRRALANANHGLAANRCTRPYRRDICVDLGREIGPRLRRQERYFAGRVTATIRAYS